MLAALVTPPDVITQVILFVVVYGLYEMSIFLVARVEKTREAKLRAEGLWFEDDDEEPEAAADAGLADDEEAFDDPLMAEFDEDEDDDEDEDPGMVNKS